MYIGLFLNTFSADYYVCIRNLVVKGLIKPFLLVMFTLTYLLLVCGYHVSRDYIYYIHSIHSDCSIIVRILYHTVLTLHNILIFSKYNPDYSIREYSLD